MQRSSILQRFRGFYANGSHWRAGLLRFIHTCARTHTNAHTHKHTHTQDVRGCLHSGSLVSTAVLTSLIYLSF